jgi:hypothetical protein
VRQYALSHDHDPRSAALNSAASKEADLTASLPSTRPTCMASHFPLPVAVGTPRSFNAFAMPLSDVAPAACTALITGPRSAAWRRALSALPFLWWGGQGEPPERPYRSEEQPREPAEGSEGRPMKKAATTARVQDDKFWLCYAVTQIISRLPQDVDERTAAQKSYLAVPSLWMSCSRTPLLGRRCEGLAASGVGS